MSLTSMLSRKDPLKRAFVTLDDGMTDILKEEFFLPPEIEADMAAEHAGSADDPAGDRDDAGRQPLPSDRISPHTQDRLSRHAAVDEANIRTSEELNRIGDALASIVSANRMGRDLLNDYHADIHRANEFENANAAYAAENRRLGERVDKLERLRARYDQLVDVLKRREAKLLADAEDLRESVATAKLELVEAQTGIARSESLNGELRAALSSRTSEAERYMRNAELLREKNVGLTLDLELANKKQAEWRRKADELAAMHASDTARLAELTARLSVEGSETVRLQKLADAIEAKFVDANESAARLAGEMTERDKRYQSENGALKSEIQTLNARLQTAAGEHRDALSEASALRSRIADLESEKQIMDQKHGDLRGELENERRQNAAAMAGGQDEAGPPQSQPEAVRREIAELRATVERLSPAGEPSAGGLRASNGNAQAAAEGPAVAEDTHQPADVSRGRSGMRGA